MSGVRTEENLVNSVVCCFSWGKINKSSQNPGLINQFSATPRGQLNWTGPIANSFDLKDLNTPTERIRLVSSHPEKVADLRGSLGNFRIRGTFLEVWETSGEPLDCC